MTPARTIAPPTVTFAAGGAPTPSCSLQRSAPPPPHRPQPPDRKDPQPDPALGRSSRAPADPARILWAVAARGRRGWRRPRRGGGDGAWESSRGSSGGDKKGRGQNSSEGASNHFQSVNRRHIKKKGGRAASRARYAVVAGAHRRVGTTCAQLIAALAATNRHGHEPSGANFKFLSSIHSNLLVEGLLTQVGWGHIWNRYAGPLSCQHQVHQCALTPLLPPAWWDGQWQSPIPRNVRRLLEYGVRLSNTGEVAERRLVSYCRSRKDHVKRYHVLPPYKSSTRV
uniref:Uncharacterized protein n=1 Tax=Arundo donax TaxID=35708 RepID=A0A0A9DFL7_ARUDO